MCAGIAGAVPPSLRRIVCWLLPGLLAACSGSPVLRTTELAADLGLEHRRLHGGPFELVVFYTRNAPGATALHVYIEGDGTPWLGPGRPAADPTPRNPLLLRLMALDPAPALYLGRPCYLGQARSAACRPWDWTHGRYGERVVRAMAEALRGWLQRQGTRWVTLVGHSGGGTLALLLAERLPGVCRVVTLAGNLDVAAWTRLHGYSPLAGSLDPARRPPLSGRIAQWHFAGALDGRVPPALIRHALHAGPSVHFVVLPGVDHRYGWEAAWPGLLRRIQAGRGCGTGDG